MRRASSRTRLVRAASLGLAGLAAAGGLAATVTQVPFLRGDAAVALAASKPKPKPKPKPPPNWYLSASQIQAIRVNVRTKPWAKLAWQETKAQADAALGQSPHPANPTADYRPQGDPSCSPPIGWFCGLYLPGLQDGRATRALALAYAVTGDKRYGLKAKDFLLAWASRYNPPPGDARIGHMIAEPVGFMLKGFMAYDLVKDVFSTREQKQFKAWAAFFVGRGMRYADFSRDHPWVPQAPWGNSATWSRALAVLAAAVVGGRTLDSTLAWNWSHKTGDGQDYGWPTLLDGSMHDDGKMIEEELRQSVAYGLYTLHPLMLIADVASHVRYEHDLWRAAVPDGKSLYRAIAYYAPYLTNDRAWPSGYTEPAARSHDSVTSEYRAVMETAANFFTKSKLLQRVVTYGGDSVRAGNADPHITGHNAVTGGLGR
jgi:hypothetical protein